MVLLNYTMNRENKSRILATQGYINYCNSGQKEKYFRIMTVEHDYGDFKNVLDQFIADQKNAIHKLELIKSYFGWTLNGFSRSQISTIIYELGKVILDFADDQEQHERLMFHWYRTKVRFDTAFRLSAGNSMFPGYPSFEKKLNQKETLLIIDMLKKIFDQMTAEILQPNAASDIVSAAGASTVIVE